jgi:hypothetical protein
MLAPVGLTIKLGGVETKASKHWGGNSDTTNILGYIGHS